MRGFAHRTLPLTVAAGGLLLLAGCMGMSDDRPINTIGAAQAETITPVDDGAVSQNNLPPLPGQTELPTYDPTQTGAAGPGGAGMPPGLSGTPGGSFQTAAAPGMPMGAPGGRDLAGPLSADKLMGRWTVISGDASCAVNLTYTEKVGTTRYRASVPGCAIAGLGAVASWQVVGNQVQLFDEADRLVAALALSGDRFVGTSAGGVGISMA